jgi:protein involved in plasmid replication-relaxation
LSSRVVSGARLPERDQAVVELVAKFKQMTVGQIRASLFAELASTTPIDRTLKRLVEKKHLSRIPRLIGGDHGGSGQYVYQLGRAGWKLVGKPGAYWAPQAVNLHTLTIADCYVRLLGTDLEVVRFTTEPECHTAAGPVLLTPDAYVEVGNRATRLKQACWLEVDRGTERLDVIVEKCVRYWTGFQNWPDEYFPIAVFVVPDGRRKQAIERAFSDGPIESRHLFKCCVLVDLTKALH